MKIDDEFSGWQREWREQDSRVPEVRLPKAPLKAADTVSFLKRCILNLLPGRRWRGRKRKGEKNRYA